MHPLVFGVLAYPGHTDAEVLLFARSLSVWGGSLAASPIWIVYPTTDRAIHPRVCDRLLALGVHCVPVEVDPSESAFPFAAKVRAAAAVEALAEAEAERLAFLDPDTLVLRSPDALLLPAGKTLGYRPVHHTLIGSIYDQPIDDYWLAVYESCQVPPARLFPMDTCVRDHVIRPYFNAGSLVVRPQSGLLRAWSETFFRWYQDPAFTDFYARDGRYAVFAHQTLLAGVILTALSPDALHELPPEVNYPLHLHDDFPAADRRSLADLVTARYEELAILNAWRQEQTITGSLAGGWLDGQLAELSEWAADTGS